MATTELPETRTYSQLVGRDKPGMGGDVEGALVAAADEEAAAAAVAVAELAEWDAALAGAGATG